MSSEWLLNIFYLLPPHKKPQRYFIHKWKSLSYLGEIQKKKLKHIWLKEFTSRILNYTHTCTLTRHCSVHRLTSYCLTHLGRYDKLAQAVRTIRNRSLFGSYFWKLGKLRVRDALVRVFLLRQTCQKWKLASSGPFLFLESLLNCNCETPISWPYITLAPAYEPGQASNLWKTQSNPATYKYEYIHGLGRCLNRKSTCHASVGMGVQIPSWAGMEACL